MNILCPSPEGGGNSTFPTALTAPVVLCVAAGKAEVHVVAELHKPDVLEIYIAI
jgi:hypothetical protein